jgi:hypothetical protein
MQAPKPHDQYATIVQSKWSRMIPNYPITDTHLCVSGGVRQFHGLAPVRFARGVSDSPSRFAVDGLRLGYKHEKRAAMIAALANRSISSRRFDVAGSFAVSGEDGAAMFSSCDCTSSGRWFMALGESPFYS